MAGKQDAAIGAVLSHLTAASLSCTTASKTSQLPISVANRSPSLKLRCPRLPGRQAFESAAVPSFKLRCPQVLQVALLSLSGAAPRHPCPAGRGAVLL